MNDDWNISGTSESNPGSREQTPFVAAEGSAAAQAATAAASAQAGAADPGYGAAPGAGAPYAPPVGSWGPAGAGYAVPPPPPPAGIVGTPSDPNPVAAFWLGLIPGVGAMYNGQVAKGFVHLIVFAVLVSIANTINIFGIFVAGWIFFMAFEAYHTAKARRMGQPLPNAFGWNDIGERMGLGKNWPFSPGVPVASPTPSSGANPGAWTGVPPASPFEPVQPIPPVGSAGYAATPNWAGYVPPSAFASAPPPGSTAGSPFAAAVPPGHGVPYVPVNAGTAYSGAPFAPPLPADQAPAHSRLPVGAIWLIGLGVLFLLSQWTPLLQVSRVWVPSILLGGLAVFLFARRMGWTGSSAWQPSPALPLELRIAGAVRVPGILLTIAILNGLHEAWIARWDHSWPWLLIAVGVLLLVERMALRQAANLNAAGNPTIPVDPAGKAGL